ncbi:MAG: CD3324 family protein [Clostridium sp.]|uniref:CD3324 family protein n=1 Tax=Clostridium sp. TaxID=1506 RepID=UPI003D6CF5B4
MCYKNGKDVLPSALLKELQKYIQGEIIYIPKEDNVRKAWGENNGTRKILRQRNVEIYEFYKNGTTITKLTESYNLSEDSIRKIIFNMNNEKLKLNA